MRVVTYAVRLAALFCLTALVIAVPVRADHPSTCGGDCRQVMLSMAFTANLFGGIQLDHPMQNRLARLTAVTAERVDCGLAGATVLAGGWERVWGPELILEPDTQVLQTPSGPKTIINTWDPAPVANAMFVAKKRDAEVYVVAIAGTDAKSQFDWVKEDFDAYPVVWPYGLHFDTVKVTRGTLTGLHLLQTMSSSGQSLEDYLHGVVTSQEATIYVTGHSLGGALAPATALWLHDRGKDWDPNDNATLKIYAFAGATPGDRAFASYTEKRFRCDNMAIVNNSLDVVPHAFGLNTLEALDTLYQAGQIEPTAEEKAAIAAIIKKVRKAASYGIYFETLGEGSQVQGFDGDLISKSGLTKVVNCDLYQSVYFFLDDYAREALYQHVCAYPVKLGVPKLNPQMAQCREQTPHG